MIPADIGTALFVLLFLVLAYLVLRWIGPKLAALRVRTVENDSGDGDSSRAKVTKRAGGKV